MDGLPNTYAKLAEQSKSLEPYRSIYQSAGGGDLPTLKFLLENGNVTTYEWIHGEAPLTIEETNFDFGADEDGEKDESNVNVEIDFDCLEISPNTDIKIPENVELDAPAEIDWGDLELPDNVGDQINIDWDDIDVINQKDHVDIVIEESGIEGGVARDTDALSLLDNRRIRNIILDELHELEAFFVQRQAEIHTLEDGAGKGNIFSLAGSGVNSDLLNDTNLMNEALVNVRALISQLCTGQLHHLQLVRSSPKYVDRLVENLKQKLRLVERCESMNMELAKKRDSAFKDQAEAQIKLKVMTSKTKVLQRNIEDDISKRYKNRKVNIQGAQSF